MKNLLLLALVCLLSVSYAQEYPSTEISNDELDLLIYLPDDSEGFYRATRFDWSGVIGSLVYRGHQYFDPWLPYHDPTIHEAITGPVEGFTPLDFERTAVGEDFLTIGVGVLKKPDNDPWRFATTYQIVDSGKWRVKKKKDRTEFKHTIATKDGYAYDYRKTVRLIENQPEFQLEHTLKNTGSKPIETTVYNHNFFVIDQEPTGPHIVTKFPFPIKAEGRGFGELIQPQESSLVFPRQLKQGETVYTANIEGYGTTSAGYDIRIENTKSGAGVHITGDRPLLKLPFWACATTTCPEPYLDIKIGPGETYTWQINYRFYEIE